MRKRKPSEFKNAEVFFSLLAHNPFLTSHDGILPFSELLFCSITKSVILVFSISLCGMVACADLLCVFLCDGTVALCNCLKDTRTFGVGYAKGRVWCHVAPGGARR